MQSFVDWLDTHPFWVRDAWDFEKNKSKGIGKLKLGDFQRTILGYCLTPNKKGDFPYSTILYSTIKKSGKTTLGAVIAAWYADEAAPGTEMYICANDLEQAEGRVFRDLKFHYRQMIANDPENPHPPKILQYKIALPNGTTIQALSQAYKTAAGSRHAFVAFDELWGFVSEDSHRMWDEMTPIPTVSNSLRLITTYAGFYNESDLLWDLYIQGVGKEEHDDGRGQSIKELKDLPCWTNGKMFTYWDHEPRMPWQTQEYYNEQLKSLRAAAYLRLHENRWVTTHESFIPVEWWDQAAKGFEGPADLWGEHPYRNYPIFVGVDGSTKHDCTACVGVAYDPKIGKLAQVFHKIWTPRKDEDFDLEATLEAFLLDRYNKYNIRVVVFDPTQLHQTSVRLRQKGLPMKEIPQSANVMITASQALFDAMKYKNFLAYPDDQARQHMQNAVAQEEGRGFRIVKEKRSRLIHKPVDFTVALALAIYEAISGGTISMDKPLTLESPFSDLSKWKPKDPLEMKLPFPLRT